MILLQPGEHRIYSLRPIALRPYFSISLPNLYKFFYIITYFYMIIVIIYYDFLLISLRKRYETVEQLHRKGIRTILHLRENSITEKDQYILILTLLDYHVLFKFLPLHLYKNRRIIDWIYPVI